MTEFSTRFTPILGIVAASFNDKNLKLIFLFITTEVFRDGYEKNGWKIRAALFSD